jgi:hypothetical protein
MNYDEDRKPTILVIESTRKLNKVDAAAAQEIIQKRVGSDYQVVLLPYGDKLAAVIDDQRGATWVQHSGQV